MIEDRRECDGAGEEPRGNQTAGAAASHLVEEDEVHEGVPAIRWGAAVLLGPRRAVDSGLVSLLVDVEGVLAGFVPLAGVGVDLLSDELAHLGLEGEVLWCVVRGLQCSAGVHPVVVAERKPLLHDLALQQLLRLVGIEVLDVEAPHNQLLVLRLLQDVHAMDHLEILRGVGAGRAKQQLGATGVELVKLGHVVHEPVDEHPRVVRLIVLGDVLLAVRRQRLMRHNLIHDIFL